MDTRLAVINAFKAAGASSAELERAVEDILDMQEKQLAATEQLRTDTQERASSQSGEMRAIKQGQERIERLLKKLLDER